MLSLGYTQQRQINHSDNKIYFNKSLYHHHINLVIHHTSSTSHPLPTKMSNTIIHTKCLGHCRAQDLAWKSSPELYAKQKAAIAAYEASQTSPNQAAEFHGHCWAASHPSHTSANSPEGDNLNLQDEKDAKACLGHVRAQEIAVRSDAAKIAYEMEKASIKGYEEGWDRWDGPVWPYRKGKAGEDGVRKDGKYGNGIMLGEEEEEEYDNGYTPPELDERNLVAKAEL